MTMNGVDSCTASGTIWSSIIGASGVLLVFVLVVTLCLLTFLLPKRRKTNLAEKHVVITGGSSGIGLALARELIQTNKCLRITILARTESTLKEAQTSLMEEGVSVDVRMYSVDVSNAEAIEKAAKHICEDDTNAMAPTVIFNVAGTSSSAALVDANYSEYERLMRINYMGSVYVTKAFLPYMLKQHPPSVAKTIVFTSSAAGQVGVYGYSAYTPTKYALRGLAEVLQMEHKRDNVSVQLCFPPDTDTPGYKLEQVDKPEETHLISESMGLFKPETVAKKMAKNALCSSPPFCVYFGFEGWMLASLTSGMSPVTGFLDALSQTLLMGIFRFISLFYLSSFYSIIETARKNKKTGAKETTNEPSSQEPITERTKILS